MSNHRYGPIQPAALNLRKLCGARTCVTSLVIGLGLLLPLSQAALAQDAVAVPPATVAAPSATGAEQAAASQPLVEGFRSATFGMDEVAVRAAIIADFGVEDAAIELNDNIAERTRILSVQVPDVLEGGGTALVSYVLGYKSNKLDQVSVLWSPDSDSTIDGAKLVANATVLQSYFLGAGYDPATSVVNAEVPEGIVMFRGLDSKNRMVLLLLRGAIDPATVPDQSAAPTEANAETQANFVSSGLTLAYLANPSAPDVFSLKPGQF